MERPSTNSNKKVILPLHGKRVTEAYKKTKQLQQKPENKKRKTKRIKNNEAEEKK